MFKLIRTDRDTRSITVTPPPPTKVSAKIGTVTTRLPRWCYDNHWETVLHCLAIAWAQPILVVNLRIPREFNVSHCLGQGESFLPSSYSTGKSSLSSGPTGHTDSAWVAMENAGTWENVLGNGLLTNLCPYNSWHLDCNLFFLNVWLHWQLS